MDIPHLQIVARLPPGQESLIPQMRDRLFAFFDALGPAEHLTPQPGARDPAQASPNEGSGASES